MSIEATSDYSTLAERNITVKQKLEEQKRQVDELAKETSDARKIAERMMKKMQEVLSQDENGELTAFMQEMQRSPEGQTIEQLESEIESEKARLELMHDGNGGVIKEYEQRKKKIDALTARIEEIKLALSELDDRIKELRDQWEPELDTLVGKISDSFSFNMQQISCAGEVSVHKDEDFDQWAIQIRVKFR